MSARRIDKTIGLAVIALAIVLALLPLVLGSAPDEVAGSVASNAPDGRRALFLVLGELGFAPEAWNEPPGRLPRGDPLVWLAAAPREWSERQPSRRSPFARDDESHRSERDRARDEHKAAGRDDARDEKKNADTQRADVDHERKSARDEPKHAANERGEARDERSTPEREKRDANGEEREDADRSSSSARTSDEVPAALRMHALSHYRRFVEEGGALVMRYDERARHFLCDELGFDELRELALDASSPPGVRHVRTERGDELDVDWPKGACLVRPSPNAPIEPLWTAARSDGETEILAVSARIGAGEIVLLGDDAFLDNAHLREHEHALLAVRLAEEANRGARILFDEYALGLWRPETASGLASSPRLFLISAHLVLLVLLFTWAAAWTKTFPRDPPPLARVSPLARARARAALFERAGRYDRLAAMLREGSLRRWSKGARKRGDGEPRSDSAAPREHDREPTSDPVHAGLARIAARLGQRAYAPRWHEALVERRVSNARELERLSRDLSAIGAEIALADRRTASHVD